MASHSQDLRRAEKEQVRPTASRSEQPGTCKELSKLEAPKPAPPSAKEVIAAGESLGIDSRQGTVLAEPHGLVRNVQSLCASVAQRPERIVDAVGAAAAAMLTVATATASGRPLTGGDIGLGIAVAGAALASVELGDQLSRNNPISVTSPLRNWCERLGTSVRWFKEAFDEDGLQVCLGALVALYCASLPPELHGKIGIGLGAARMVISLTCVAALQCMKEFVALPCAVMSTLYRAVAKPIHECARWASGESITR
jgi:hypothetical protein